MVSPFTAFGRIMSKQQRLLERSGFFSDSDNVNYPPATFHAVQEEQSSCQGKKPCHADRISFLAHVLQSRVNRSRSIGTLHPRPAACRGRWFRVFPERRWVLWSRSSRWLAGLQRAVMGHAVPGCLCVQAGRGEDTCSVRGDLSDRPAPVHHGRALALLLGV